MSFKLDEYALVDDVNVILPSELALSAAIYANKERSNIVPAEDLGNELVISHRRLWAPGRVLRVRFLDGTEDIWSRTLEVAQEWTRYANLTLMASDSVEAELRVSFDPNDGCWSYIGTDACAIPKEMATMNISVMGGPSIPEDYRKYILHEFGHAIGCVHEHQSPVAGIQWNLPELYRHYRKKYGWSRSKVDQNIVLVMEESITNHTDSFDPDSIMVYPISSQHTLDGYSVKWNDHLSDRDKEFISTVYKW